MTIDSNVSVTAVSFTPKIVVDLAITQDISVISPPEVTPPAATSRKGKEKQRTIMIYDVPTTWSSDKIRSALANWGHVLNISFKAQHKYFTIRIDTVLIPIKDTEFILMPWCTQLGGI
ncbi:hypothetical protein GLOIN_2v1689837 [Rhizophagus clarus]|uniref:Uncharacterized protein n=1 Tax=Rhizophagus clarus TaxID=94130 RepID=A0A8H3L2S6_9GLOM|nr:hypothetical protein GLOIN_2v1689837 [Rhizophagus clarus]